MSWNGKQFGRSLVMLRHMLVRDMNKRLGMPLPEEVAPLVNGAPITDELALYYLLQHDRIEDAVNLLSYAITPRVGVWWAYRCYQAVQQDIAADFAKDGLTPKQRRDKERRELVAKLTDTSDIDRLVEENKRAIEEGRKQLQALAEQMGYKSPMERMAEKAKLMQQEIEKLKALYSEDVQAAAAPATGRLQPLMEEMLGNARRSLEGYIESQTPVPEPTDTPSTRVYDAIRAKVAAVKPAIDAEMAKHFPLKMHGLPKQPSPEMKAKAVDAALRWLLVPSDENGALANQAAVAAKGGPESMLAFAAFWSSTNMKTETGIAPGMEALPPQGISKTLLQLALQEGGEMDYDARYRLFLDFGIECADGTSTWDIDENGSVKEVRKGV